MDAPASQRPSRLVSWLPAFAAVGAFAAAVAAPLFVAGWDPAGFNPRPGDNARHAALLWLAVVSAEGAIWFFAGCWTIWRIWRLTSGPGSGILAARTLVPPFLLGSIFLCFVHSVSAGTGFPPSSIGPLPIPNLAWFRILGLSVAGLACSGLLLAWCLHTRETGGGPPGLAAIRRAQDRMSEFLYCGSANLAFAVLSAAALRKALDAAKAPSYSADFVVSYGAVHSILMLTVYLPIRIALRAEAEKAISALMPPPADIDAIKPWMEKRASADEYLGNTAKSLYGAGGLAAATLPLLTGWITQMLK